MPSVHVIVLIGAGERFFCAGANIGMLKDADPTFKYYFCLHANETLNRLEQTPKLVIAALNGHCVGGGLEVAMAADLRVARAGRRQDRPARSRARRPARHRRHPAAGPAGRQGQGDGADGHRGAAHDGRGARLPAWSTRCGARTCWPAARSATPPSTTPRRSRRRTGPAAPSATSSAPCSRGSKPASAEGLALERELQQRLFESDDAAEGLAANLEKRPPRFTGR